MYISDVGGWVPSGPDPLGDGALANGFTEEQVADVIIADQFGLVYDLNLNVMLTVNVQVIAQITDGLNFTGASGAMLNQISSFITDTINNSSIPVQVLSVVQEAGTANPPQVNNDSSVAGGYTTPTNRHSIAASISNVSITKEIDYKGLALMFVQNTYGVDDTWNVYAVYTETNQPIAIIINKYTDDTFVTLDNSDTTTYVINVSPVTYQIVSGVIIN